MTLLSVIVPARDEQDNIGPCLSSLLLAAAGLDCEIVVADDRSTDRTAAIVRSMPGVRLVDVPPLAAGWCGKTHALAFAAPTTSGSWILFTDADTRHSPGSLQGVLERAGEYDLYSLSPEQETVTWWERAVIPRVFAELERLFSYDDINRPDSEVAAANGQFLLIRRSAYDALGGHGAVAREFLEDLALARLAKLSGFRIHLGPGSGVVRTRMYSRFPAMWHGWTRNLFQLYGQDSRNMLRAAARQAVDLPGGPLLSVLLVNSLIRHRCHLALTWKGREYPALSPVTDRPAAGGGTCPTGLQ